VVYIEHGYRDLAGHRYQSLYAHLNRVTVARGERVRAGQPIGTLGGSSMGSRTKMGAHLHFALYQDAGSKGLGGGRAVLPEPMGYHRNLRGGKQFVACGRPEPVPVASLPPEPIRLPTDHRGLLAVGGLLPLE
jgi:murein DD-endopeptidase MepM/ murein hydrolase activator NlpD